MALSGTQALGTARRQLQDAPDLPRLNAGFRRMMAEHGFTAYAAGYLPAAADGAEEVARQPFLLMEWPKAWLELYARRGFAQDDVVIAQAARTSEPFTWSEIRERHPGASAHIFEAAAEFGWRDGFAIPVHDLDGLAGETFGVVSLAARDLSAFGPDSRVSVVALALAAFGAARRLAASGPPQPGRQLTPREAEALTLVSEGFSDDEIAHHMGVGRRTAHFHVENAKLRLGATSRAQAVAIALTNGLLA